VPGLGDLLRTGAGVLPSSSSPFLAEVAAQLEAQLAAISAQILEACRRDIPEYAAIEDPVELAALMMRCGHLIAVFARVLRNQPGVLAEEYEFARQLGRARAEEGFPLSAVVSALRLGMNVGWEHVAGQVPAPQSPEDANTVMAVALQLMNFVGEVSRAVTEGYLDVAPNASAARERTNQALVDDFLSGSFLSDEDLGSRAARFRYDLRSKHAIVLLAARTGEAPLDEGESHRPIVDPWIQAGEALMRRVPDALPIAVVPAPIPHAAALVPAPSMAKWPELLAICEEVRVEHGVTILAVPPVAGAVAIYDSYTDARDSLGLARRVLRGQERVASVEDLRIYRVLQGRLEDRRLFLRSTLGPVLDLKENRRQPLLESLEAWYLAQGRFDEAARRMFVHPNTLRYRLRRVEELTGLSLRTPHDQVRLDLALHLLRLQDDPADS
jgi:sugar diacid utilization regulator